MRDKRSSKDRMSGQRSLKSEKSGEGKINGLATHVGSGRHNHKHSAHVEDPVKTITFPAEVQLFKSLEGNRTLSTHSVTPISDCKPGQKVGPVRTDHKSTSHTPGAFHVRRRRNYSVIKNSHETTLQSALPLYFTWTSLRGAFVHCLRRLLHVYTLRSGGKASTNSGTSTRDELDVFVTTANCRSNFKCGLRRRCGSCRTRLPCKGARNERATTKQLHERNACCLSCIIELNISS